MGIIRQSTAATVLVGPVLDSSGAEYTSMVIGDLNVTKNGTTAAMAAAATLTHSHNGYYLLAMTTGNTDTVGLIAISSNKSTYSMGVHRFNVVEEAVYDALFAASGAGYQVPIWAAAGSTVNLSATTIKTATDVETDTADIQSRLPSALVSGRIDASVGAMASGVITAASIAADAITDAKVASDVTIASVTGSVGSVVGLTASNLDETISSRMATYTQPTGFLAATFPSDPADQSLVIAATDAIIAAVGTRASQTSVDTIDDFLDTEVAAIKAKTDQFVFTVANQVDANALTGGGGGSGTGARTVTPTVLVSGTPLEGATVRFTLGAESYTGTTNSSGQKVFNLDDGTYTVSIAKPGYSFTGTTLAVDGTETPSYTMTANSVTPPSDPSLSTLTVLCLDASGAAEPDVVIQAKLSKIPSGGTGYAYDAAIQEATSDGDGIATLTVVRLATYMIKRGTSKQWTSVLIADVNAQEIQSFVGAD